MAWSAFKHSLKRTLFRDGVLSGSPYGCTGDAVVDDLPLCTERNIQEVRPRVRFPMAQDTVAIGEFISQTVEMLFSLDGHFKLVLNVGGIAETEIEGVEDHGEKKDQPENHGNTTFKMIWRIGQRVLL